MPEILRYGAAKFSRRNPLRKISVELLKSIYGARPRLPRGLSVIRPLDMPGLAFLPTDSMVMEAVYWFGVRGYEGVMSDVWKRLCGRSSNILEIGANVGLFSVLGGGAAPSRYTAVECLPEVANILRANLELNALTRVEVIQAAAIPDATARDVTINIPDEDHAAPVGAHLAEKVEVGGRSTLKEITVRGMPVAELVQGRDLIKIDAEGIEAQLLLAAREVIVRDKPTLVLEVLPEAAELGGVISQLAKDAGYTIHIVPGYGSDTIVTIPAAQFGSETPQRFHSKDVVLSTHPVI